jgi:predicted anti-sigma-YlaC factor YlaD
MGIRGTCREVHRLTSESYDRELTLTERLRLRVHLALCGGCRNFSGQMRLLHGAMRRFTIADAPDDEEKSK